LIYLIEMAPIIHLAPSGTALEWPSLMPDRPRTRSETEESGNLVGGYVFTGLAIYTTYKPAATADAPPLAVPARVPAE
jgi:hypothetical protein